MGESLLCHTLSLKTDIGHPQTFKWTWIVVMGSRPAGGCLLALCCDYRIMTDNRHYNIGLNEKQLGIVAPFW
ncbi:hypothetical protein cypCar_00007245 [Cyprinus carpio]|nr:hypothetical protein cypCar_00007245 [Cyprinus carpio]